MSKVIFFALLALIGVAQTGCSGNKTDFEADSKYQSTTEDDQSQDSGSDSDTGTDTDSEDILDHVQNDLEGTDSLESIGDDIFAAGCSKASENQKSNVYLGWTKKDEFLQKCAARTKNSSWCAQVVRPNPRSSNTFKCTYGSSLPHNLIHPNESTWKYPIEGVRVIQDLSAMGIKVKQIYNWWRPEPYNKNVGGAAGRHPYGTAIDVRFASSSEADKAFKALCKMRRAGRIRAIGHYGSSALHIGVGDRLANTWGKSCN